MAKEIREIETEVLPPNETPFERDEKLVRLISRLMDTVFVVPGTNIRFGLDPIIGMLPGAGDMADALISAFLISRSARYGVPKIVIARMALNVLINTLGGAVPVVGDAFSIWWKSNVMNYELLRKHATSRRAPTKIDWVFVIGIIAFLVLVIVLVAAATFWLLGKLFQR
ncbi:MAG: DUF4112 domain-containing protein [Verrucomicrobiota bacterium]|nr:DUF4112 domain-containing protein [Verrucomicrobiota bacterium]